MVEKRAYVDRSEAGVELGKILKERYERMDVLVLGIPRGGVIVAYEVARVLQGDLSVVVTKKLPHPLQEELAIGACAEDGSVFLTSTARGLKPEVVLNIVGEQMEEIRSRIDRFRDGRPLPEINNRNVLIVDDGIATGSTIVPAIKLCKARKAAMVVVAAPVSGQRYVSEINDLSDEVVIPLQPEDFYAVGQVYEDFHHVSDAEVKDLLRDYGGERMSSCTIRRTDD